MFCKFFLKCVDGRPGSRSDDFSGEDDSNFFVSITHTRTRMMLGSLLAAVVVVILCFDIVYAQQAAWRIVPSAASRPSSSFVPPIATPQETLLTLNFDALALLFKDASLKLESRGIGKNTKEEEIEFLLPDASFKCYLRRSELLADGLQTTLPKLIIRQGKCTDGRQVSLNMLLDSNSSFSATFNVPNSLDWIYVDHVNGTNGRYYVAYPKSSKSASPDNHLFSCKSIRVNLTEEDDHPQGSLRQLASSQGTSTTTTTTNAMFRLAVATSRPFSQFAGDTVDSVANAVAIIVSRVNGIYQRELGVYFQLIAANNRLLCVGANTENCYSQLPDNDGTKILYNAMGFMKSRGVASDEYDIGHVFTTGSGGIAALGVLCDPNWKASGNTGMPTPVGDPFSVDYVSHELGHQMSAAHSFKDCDGANEEAAYAVEPGSGSTIMGYAGICGSRDLQAHSDAYFHPVNLIPMRNFINNKLNRCGISRKSSTTFTSTRPAINSALPTCTIPVGNAFRLNAGVNAEAKWFEWESIYPGSQSYINLNNPRFRSWKPQLNITYRYFPNLYYLTHNLQDAEPYNLFEKLPSKSIILPFRFVARSQFDSASFSFEYNNDMVGDFAYRDVNVIFSSQVPALKFTNETRTALQQSGGVQAGGVFQFKWNAGGAAAMRVEILVAINTMLYIVPQKAFNSDTDIKPLDWLSIGIMANTGLASLVIPRELAAQQVNFMIRAVSPSNGEDCWPFDYVGKAYVRAVDEKTEAPVLTFEPTSQPTFPVATEFSNVLTADGITVMQTLYKCPGALECTTTQAPTCFHQNNAKRFVEYMFTAQEEGMFAFSTRSSNATCQDTLLGIGSGCDDNSDVGKQGFSVMTRNMKVGDSAVVLVSSPQMACSAGDTVALTATKVFKVQSSETVRTEFISACTLGNANCAQLACSTATKFIPYLFNPKANAKYEFSLNTTRCPQAVVSYTGDEHVCVEANADETKASVTLGLKKGVLSMIFVGSKRDQCNLGNARVAVSASPPYYVAKPNLSKFASFTNTCLAGTFGCAANKCLTASKFVAFTFEAESAGNYQFATVKSTKSCSGTVISVNGTCNASKVVVKNVKQGQVIKVFVGAKADSCKETKSVGVRVTSK